MTCTDIISELQNLSSEKHKKNVVKLGVPEENSLGVSTGEIRKLAKKIGKSNELADELWNTGYHEARLLAVLVYDAKTMNLETMESMMEEVVSWDLCDHLCKNLLIKQKDYDILIHKWCIENKTYIKRAAFVLIASAAIHDKKLSASMLDDYLNIIKEHANDEREYVKKAISWALREIGKKDFEWQEKAILVAHELKESGDKAQVWIAKDALKELETLVRVEGRKRLISADSKMGQEK